MWSIIAACIIVGVLLARKMRIHIMIIGTSLVGAYALVRGVASFIGGYPNEAKLYQEASSGEDIGSFPWTFYVYFVFIIAFFIGGSYY